MTLQLHLILSAPHGRVTGGMLSRSRLLELENERPLVGGNNTNFHHDKSCARPKLAFCAPIEGSTKCSHLRRHPPPGGPMRETNFPNAAWHSILRTADHSQLVSRSVQREWFLCAMLLYLLVPRRRDCLCSLNTVRPSLRALASPRAQYSTCSSVGRRVKARAASCSTVPCAAAIAAIEQEQASTTR
ncbi:hypothetical protein BDZ91DRAFT_766545 [Kalaharituber pfeilii]|nr:hypothetical protein BDZ91DRAFT_766545 [Kalaharituber pfeilii]